VAVRLDSMGDVLLAGPAVRALAASSHVDMLVGPQGRDAADLLPGVDDVVCWTAPWIVGDPGPVRRHDVESVVDELARRRYDRAVVFTSFHQSALPTALVLRMAGVAWVAGVSEDYPGSLLDVRHPPPGDVPEAVRALELAAACGAQLPPGDDGRLHVRHEVLRHVARPVPEPYVVVHPGTSVPARAWPAERHRAACAALSALGHRVVVTGGPDEAALTAYVADASATGAVDLGGRTDLRRLAGVLAAADAVVVGNTGPAHLAAAVGTPVVSLFAPTVPAARWAPYGVPTALLGDQRAACAATRATRCSVAGHPCLNSVEPMAVVEAVRQLVGRPVGAPGVTAQRSSS
jgi:ADP-heptose:LPS heptosyltransferase